MNKNYISGAVYGLAYGDGWGFRTEFQKDYEVLKNLPKEPKGLLTISDDTQMSLYLMEAVTRIGRDQIHLLEGLQHHESRRNDARRVIADSFLAYAQDPDNNRAPGMTVMNSLYEYRLIKESLGRDDIDSSALWGSEGAKNNSKGCGANMRAPWLGLLELHEEDIINLAIIQAEVTHSHPLALASAAMTAYAMLLVKTEPNLFFKGLTNRIIEATESYYHLTAQEGAIGVGGWNPNFSIGLRELLVFFESKKEEIKKVRSPFFNDDVCAHLGAGWVAEEALLNALVVFDKDGRDVIKGLNRLVHSTGDSDSIAAIGGAFLGARHGAKTLEKTDSFFEFRYRKELKTMVDLIEEFNEDLVEHKPYEDE